MFIVDTVSLDGVVVISVEHNAPLEMLLEALKQEHSFKQLAQERPILLQDVGVTSAQQAIIFAVLHEHFPVFAEERPEFQTPSANVWYSRSELFARGASLKGCGRLVRKGPHKDVSAMIAEGQRRWNEQFAQLVVAP